ncbi:MAG: hypothetical protein NC092_04285 [Butyrivibrio sp.]|nr:hypothetical protein [Muribaculum sp.]MCM1551894.1 hypothetical protein [Butyrivibrio sp.]
MGLRREGCQRRNTDRVKGVKDQGQIEWVVGPFFVLLLSILAYTQLQLASWRSTAAYLEDALAASNLAAALIDVKEYGKTNKVCIKDEEMAYDIFLDAVQDNLCLNEQWECANTAMISGPVEIRDFVIYNVDKKKIKAARVGANGLVKESWDGALGQLRAPNGVLVEHTGIYSEISFPVEGFMGITVEAHKGKLVDIVSMKGDRLKNGDKKG